VTAAKQVFEESGFLDARVSDIAERAGLSHGSFYHYFDSKEEIFREVAAAVDERLSAPLGSVMLDPSSHAPPDERMHEAMRQYLEAYRAEARIMGVIEQVARYDKEVGRLRQARQQHYAEQIAESIRELQRRGLADPRLKPAVAAAALGSMTSRFSEIWLVQGAVKTTMDDAVEQLALLFVNAMRLVSETRPAASRIKAN
jgi:AcrR family transcriptional regulator